MRTRLIKNIGRVVILIIYASIIYFLFLLIERKYGTQLSAWFGVIFFSVFIICYLIEKNKKKKYLTIFSLLLFITMQMFVLLIPKLYFFFNNIDLLWTRAHHGSPQYLDEWSKSNLAWEVWLTVQNEQQAKWVSISQYPLQLLCKRIKFTGKYCKK